MPGRADQPQAVDEVFDPDAWLGSFPQAKDVLAVLPQDEQRETEQHWERGYGRGPAAVTGALTAAVMPATDEIRSVSSRPSQIAA